MNGHLRSLLRTPLSRGIVTLSSFNRSTTASSSSASSSAASIPLFRTSPSPFTLLNTVHQHQPTKSIHAYTKTQAEANETNKQTTTPTPTPTVTPTPTPSAGATASSSASGGAKSGTGGPNSSRGTRAKKLKDSNSNMLQYLFGVAILVVGASWAAIPLYRLFCAHTGYGGTTQTDKDGSKLATLKPGKREVVVSFNADVSPSMHWKFIPSQKHLKIRLGEPVLAFYKATNLRDKAITGVATYNVTPQKSGAYFHKIQCFWSDDIRRQLICARESFLSLLSTPAIRPPAPTHSHRLACFHVLFLSLPLSASMSSVFVRMRPSICRSSSTSTQRSDTTHTRTNGRTPYAHHGGL